MSSLSPITMHSTENIQRLSAEAPFAQRQPARSVYDVFVASAERHPERTALTMLMTGADDEQSQRVSYRELLALIRRAANLFTRVGGPRPGVAYLLPSLVGTHATLWGAETAGFAVPLNPLLQATHLADLVQASGATVLVALGANTPVDFWDKALQVRQLLPHLALVRVAPPGAPPAEGAVDFFSALMQEPGDRLTFEAAGRDDEVAAYFHTGGTTGAPKLVAHTHRNQIVAAWGGMAMLGLTERDVLTSGFPLFHVAGTIACGLCCFMAGAEVLLMSPGGFRNPAMISGFWRIVAKHRATVVGAVPTALGAILDVPIAGADLSCVRLGICGAASLPRATGERFEHLTGKPLHEILGMTEAAGLVSIDPAGVPPTPGSVGFPLPYTEVRVLRLLPGGGLGEVCAAGEIGVLTVRGPTVSPGYRDPQQNHGVFEGGLLNSGDLAYTDAAGHVFVAGRAKDLIIRGGHNIDPLMIENAMAKHPAVALAAAVAQPDAYAGELPVCYVSLRPGSGVSVEDLQRHAEEHIAERPAWPRQIHVVDAIPQTNVGKIYKPQLRVDAAERMLRQLVHQQLGLPQARVTVADGGKRGLRVGVTLAAADAGAAARVREALAAFVFEAEVVVED